MLLIPPVNLKGRFTLKEPLNNLLNPNINYKVYAVESINKMLADEVDVKTVIYINQGLTADDYLSNLENSIPIVTLVTEGEKYYYIPVSYITNMPEATGVVYKQKAIVFNLGYIADNIDIDYIAYEVKDIIKSMSGLDTTYSIEDMSGSYLLNYEDADVRESARLANITNKTTCASKLREARALIDVYKIKVQALLNKLNS